MWKLIWTGILCCLGCIFAINQLDISAGMYICVCLYVLGGSVMDDGYHKSFVCVFLFRGKLTGFPCLKIQISAHKDCFKCLWKSLETMDSCQGISVMIFCPAEYATAAKKQCSKKSLTTSITTSSEVRHYYYLLFIF